MKNLLLILTLFVVACQHEGIDENYQSEMSRPEPPPEWTEDGIYQNPNLIIAGLEMGVSGFPAGYGVKAALPTTGITTIEDRHIHRWGLPGTLGEVRRVMKFNCPQGNTSYLSDFWVKRGKGVVAPVINDFFFPGMLAQKLYKRTAEGLALVTKTNKENFFVTNTHHYLDSPDNGPYYGGDTMYISKRSFDFYFGYLFVDQVEQDYLIWVKTDPYNYLPEENDTDNWAAAGIHIDGSGLVSWNPSVESDDPAPVQGLEAIVDKKGQTKSVSLLWGCPNDNYEIYRDGILVGTSEQNGFVHYFTGSTRGTYKVVSIIEGIGSTFAEIKTK